MLKKNILFLLFLACFSNLFAQQVTTTFGKNRVQFNQDFKEWLQYESPNFVGYWYGNARNVGQAAVQFAEYDNAEIQHILEHHISDKIELIVYTDLTDIKQSNIGEEDVFTITGSEHPMSELDQASSQRTFLNNNNLTPNNRIIGNKIFVYFDGNHQHLRRQIREGIATIYLNSMLYGANIQEVVQNAIAYSLPEWYKQGIVAYAAEEWNVDKDNVLKDIVLSPKFKNFKRFAKENPTFAGHSFWYYISQTYGKQTLSNLLYITRINRNIESGFQYILGNGSEKIYDSWESFFKERYANDMLGKEILKDGLKTKYRGRLPIQSAKISPNGNQIAYIINDVGRCKVFLEDLSSKKRTLILRTGFYNLSQTTDYDYPIIAWKPNGYEVSVIYEKRDKIKLFTYDTKLKKTSTEPLLADFQRVYSADYVSNSDLAMSATTNGFSDIFVYRTIGRNFDRITNDFYDDLDVSATRLKNQKGLLWASNRPDSLLTTAKIDSTFPLGNFDIYYLNLEKRTQNPIQLSYTPQLNERNPVGIDSVYFAYLAEGNGIVNRDIAYADTVFDHIRTSILFKEGGKKVEESDFTPNEKDKNLIDTLWKTSVYRTVAFAHHESNFSRNIIHQHIATKNKKAIDLIYENRKFNLFIHQIDTEKKATPLNTVFRQLQFLKNKPNSNGAKSENFGNTIEKAVVDTIKKMAQIDTTSKHYEDYFQSPFPNSSSPNEENHVALITQSDSDFLKNKMIQADLKPVNHEIHLFRGTKVLPYRLKFRTDDVSLLKFDNRPLVNQSEIFTGGFSSPPTGMLSKMTFKDLLEDHKLEIGARFSLFVPGKFNTFNNANSTILGGPPSNGIQQNANYNSREYYVSYWAKKTKIDKKYTYYRRVNTYNDSYYSETRKSKLISDIGELELRYPFDIYSSLRLTSTLRLDKLIYLATDSTTLKAPIRNEQRISLRAEYVYDNALQFGTNLWTGTRFKAYFETAKGLRVQVAEDPTFNLKNGFLGVLGFDARHYQRLDRRSILALRLAGATSFGNEKMLYVLGGVEGGFRLPSPNNLSLPEGNFAFVQPANQLRGFGQNIRNGNSVVLFNAELRVPITQYIFPNVRANWLKNLQIVGFFDAGTAWHGTKLFGNDNPLNTVYIPDTPGSPIKLKVNYFRDPIVAGYGAGVRTMIMGYYVKFDYAYGIETRTVQKPIKYFSLGTDF
jgi:hypothetical protein